MIFVSSSSRKFPGNKRMQIPHCKLPFNLDDRVQILLKTLDGKRRLLVLLCEGENIIQFSGHNESVTP